uniref:Adenylyltransferase and sulfurtransferase MOCS3 homolog n=1 Tax=Hirondellea gigas TaxID=1518452 RepID=A0A6A7G899_9CRUS
MYSDNNLIKPTSKDACQLLSHEEIARYSRQMILPELGKPGQILLANAHVLVIGCGSLGCPAALYLTAAGIGTIGLLDYGTVELSNLNREVLHTEHGVGASKVDTASSFLKTLNSHVNIVLHKITLNKETACDIIQNYDIILDCSNNAHTACIINNACVFSRKPFVSSHLQGFECHLRVYNSADGGPCYKCLNSTVDLDPVTGSMGALAGVMGCMQALEAIKLAAKIGSASSGLLFQGALAKFEKENLQERNKSCEVCGTDPVQLNKLIEEQICDIRTVHHTNGYKKGDEAAKVMPVKELSGNTGFHENYLICSTSNEVVSETASGNGSSSHKMELSSAEIARYSSQMNLPELGKTGQLLLSNACVLVVGCGGLGCPSSLYLAAAGVGTIGLLDYDEVEMSNLHRQVLHTEHGVGTAKVDSVTKFLKGLNSTLKIIPHKVVLDSRTALDVIKSYDIVLDCTDNVATRYLINDACVLSNKPLISGAALRWEGQITVYNYKDGPCYRCLFPKPPPPETVTNCSDGGVMGVVPGIIGCMQALETIKIITNIGSPLSSAMLLFNGLRGSFQKIKLRSKQPHCVVCGDNPTITKLIDYEQFCGAKAEDKEAGVSLLSRDQRLTVLEYKNMLASGSNHLLLDVRQPVELGICCLDNAVNIPYKEISRAYRIEQIKLALKERKTSQVICLCRRGNDSQLAAVALKKVLQDCVVKDIVGGLTQWARLVDNSMPIY